MDNLEIRVSNIETSFKIEKKESVISFLGRTLYGASLASNKDSIENQTATINGKVYTFKNKVINVNTESLPKLESISFGENTEVLKSNFIGFMLTEIFSGLETYRNLNIHKNKVVNEYCNKCTSLISLVTVLLDVHSIKTATKQKAVLEGKKISLECPITKSLPKLKEDIRKLKAEVKEITNANLSYAKLLNSLTNDVRLENKA